jgi:hypothetical protein
MRRNKPYEFSADSPLVHFPCLIRRDITLNFASRIQGGNHASKQPILVDIAKLFVPEFINVQDVANVKHS